jgi:hypothetical protein
VNTNFAKRKNTVLHRITSLKCYIKSLSSLAYFPLKINEKLMISPVFLSLRPCPPFVTFEPAGKNQVGKSCHSRGPLAIIFNPIVSTVSK